MVYWVPILSVTIASFLIYLGGSIARCIYPRVKGQPANWVFSVVWPILFICLAFAGQMIWGFESTGRRIGFILLLLTLVLWPFVHWYWCAPSFSMIVILLSLILSTLLLISVIPKGVNGSKNHLLVALLLLPLVLWLAYASVLNWRTAKEKLAIEKVVEQL